MKQKILSLNYALLPVINFVVIITLHQILLDCTPRFQNTFKSKFIK
jgi:hypothetical protein